MPAFPSFFVHHEYTQLGAICQYLFEKKFCEFFVKSGSPALRERPREKLNRYFFNKVGPFSPAARICGEKNAKIGRPGAPSSGRKKSARLSLSLRPLPAICLLRTGARKGLSRRPGKSSYPFLLPRQPYAFRAAVRKRLPPAGPERSGLPLLSCYACRLSGSAPCLPWAVPEKKGAPAGTPFSPRGAEGFL